MIKVIIWLNWIINREFKVQALKLSSSPSISGRWTKHEALSLIGGLNYWPRQDNLSQRLFNWLPRTLGEIHILLRSGCSNVNSTNSRQNKATSSFTTPYQRTSLKSHSSSSMTFQVTSILFILHPWPNHLNLYHHQRQSLHHNRLLLQIVIHGIHIFSLAIIGSFSAHLDHTLSIFQLSHVRLQLQPILRILRGSEEWKL